MPHISFRAIALLLALASLPAGANEPDPRQAYREGHSPNWLRAVGRLEVPGIRYEDGRRRHHTERCSATLVSARATLPADTIVTAWHCIEYYEDLSLPILFTLNTRGGEPLLFKARRLADGGGMAQDWAILRLNRAVAPEQAPALRPEPGQGETRAALVMAGFSRDPGPGRSGELLSYDPACRVTAREAGYTDSDCRAFRGASGGAVIQLSPGGQPWLSGVISQGDGEQLSRFIPVAVFRSALSRILGR